MKKLTIIAVIFVVAAGLATAQNVKDSPVFQPYSPEVLAQGSSFTAASHGYNALFSNPAGFRRENGSFTLLSATATPYFVPTPEQVEELQGIDLENDPTALIETLSGVVTSNGLGAGITGSGFGIVGRGFGLGLVTNADVYGRGRTALGTTADVSVTAAAIAGYALPLRLGFADFYFGANVRFMQRAEIPDIALTDVVSTAFSDTEEDITFDALYGNGLAIDAGLIVERGPFTLGINVRDLGGTKMNYTKYTGITPDQLEGLANGTLTGTTPEDEYRIPMTVSYGASFHPDLGPFSWLIDPTVHFEISDTMYEERDPSFWSSVHAGAEVRVLRFMKARAGINQGYVTAGAGIKLLFLDVNVAYFSREMSDYAGYLPNEGMSLEAAIRF